MHLINISFLIYFLLCFDNLSANDGNFDPYKTLGLSRTASDQEIRKAYKKLAKHWHPDKNSEPNAHDQFTKINAAYEVNQIT
jgi:DnaJ family protein C protein 16